MNAWMSKAMGRCLGRAGLVAAGWLFAASGLAQVVDPTFTATTNGDVNVVVPMPGGKFLIGGEFTLVNGQTRWAVARLNADGSLDSAFVPPLFDNQVNALVVMADGRVVVGGEFENVAGATRRYVARLNADGSLDATFQPNIAYGVTANVTRLVVQSDNKVVIAGRFDNIDGIARSRLARLNANGSLDSGFPDPEIDDSVEAMALQPDGRILIGGDFTEVHGATREGVARLLANGALDAGFVDPGVSFVAVMALQPDGKILIGGAFGDVGNLVRPYLARLLGNGQVDGSLGDAGIRFGGRVRQIQPAVDGRILISGDWTWLGESSGAARVVVVSAAGVRDLGFSDVLMSGYAMSMALHAGGRPVVGGFFTAPRPWLFAINTQDAATEDTLLVDGNSVYWLRDGLAPALLAPPQLETSSDGIVYTPVGTMTAVTEGWRVTGLSPPGGAAMQHYRARGKVNGGGYVDVQWTPSTEVFRDGFE